MTDEEFAAHIRRLAETLTTREICEVATMSTTTVERWKQGKTTPHRLMMPRVLEILEEAVRRKRNADR